jgi:hypothetical protein
MKTIIIIIILLLIICILCNNKTIKSKDLITQTVTYPSEYEDFDLDKILKNKQKNNIYDDLEKMIELELSKKYDEQIDITVPKPSANLESVNNIPSKINNNVGNKTIWETFDTLVDDNSSKIKHFDKLENNYSITTTPVLEYGAEKGSLYFDNY